MKLSPFVVLALISPASGSALAQAPANPPAPPPAAAAPAADPAEAAKLDIEETTHDFGRIGEGSVVKHSIKITNAGKKELDILELRPSCGCVHPTIRDKKKKFAPGESGFIDIEWEPNSKEGDKEYYVFLRTNDPTRPADFKLTVKAHTLAFVFSDASEGVNITGDRGSKLSKNIKIRGRAADFKATYGSVTCDAPVDMKIVGEPHEVTINGEKLRECDAVITVSDKAAPGRYTGEIFVRHNDARAKMLQIPFTMEVFGQLKVDPSTLNAGETTAGKPVGGTVVVKNSKGTPFKVLSAKYSPERVNAYAMDVTVEPGDKPDAWNIKVSGTAPVRRGRINGEIIVTTDLAEESTIRIPVFINVISSTIK